MAHHTGRTRTAQNGFAVRDLRVKAKLSVDELAQRIGVQPSHMRNIENEHRLASDEHLERIADAVGCRLSSLQRSPGGAKGPTTQNGGLIRDLRLKGQMSVDELAQRVGVSTPHMRNIENEQRSASEEHLERIAHAVDCRPQSLRRESLANRFAATP